MKNPFNLSKMMRIGRIFGMTKISKSCWINTGKNRNNGGCDTGGNATVRKRVFISRIHTLPDGRVSACERNRLKRFSNFPTVSIYELLTIPADLYYRQTFFYI